MRGPSRSALGERLASLAMTVLIADPEGIVIIKYSDLLTGLNFPQRYHLDLLRRFAWFQSGIGLAVVIRETCRSMHSRQDLATVRLRNAEVTQVQCLFNKT